MRLTREGMYRRRGITVLIREKDGNFIQKTATGVKVAVGAGRGQGASYCYELHLGTQEIVECLLKCPPDTIAEALRNLGDKFKLKNILPEIHRQLALGAFPLEPPAEE
jgi:hypothetical protein